MLRIKHEQNHLLLADEQYRNKWACGLEVYLTFISGMRSSYGPHIFSKYICRLKIEWTVVFSVLEAIGNLLAARLQIGLAIRVIIKISKSTIAIREVRKGTRVMTKKKKKPSTSQSFKLWKSGNSNWWSPIMTKES